MGTYNAQINRTDAAALIPQERSREIIKGVCDSGWLFNMAKRLPDMTSSQVKRPVLASLASAAFVAADTGLKETTELSWGNKYIDAEEIACIVPIPEAVLDDAEYDIWAETKSEIIDAFNVEISKAVLYGTNIPTSWTTNLGAAGIVAHATSAGNTVSIASFDDVYAAIFAESSDGAADGVYALLGADGYMPTGNVADVTMMPRLLGNRSTTGVPLFNPVPQENASYMLNGIPMYMPNDGSIDSSSGLMISGDWSKLVYAMRQDMTFKILDQAVIQDAAGNIIYNLAQQDMVALRCVMRLGFALQNPINRMEETEADRSPFCVLTA
jgi:HK97 family phage major capsid protein